MNKTWMLLILGLALGLLLLLKTHEQRALVPYFKTEKSLRLPQFQRARLGVTQAQLPVLELWESMLTGRVAPLDRWMRKEYKTLALSHLFTPSGFHLSALLWPLLLLVRKKGQRAWIMAALATLVSFLPGQNALKRMTVIKFQQQFFGLKTGFFFALFLDVLRGGLSASPLGFTYSFLFLGIIYSGARGMSLFIWFFIAQVMIAFVQGTSLSPLLLLTMPLINTLFALILPILFLLAFPLCHWQLTLGLFLLKWVQVLVSFFYALILKFPLLEVNCGVIFFCLLILSRRTRLAVLICLILSSELDLGREKIPVPGSYEWQASGRIMRVNGDKVFREDGICVRKLVLGVWIETCSPRRGSRMKET